MMDVGRLCVKIAGRDAGKKCVIVDVVDDRFVMIDGETRRRKCNLKHLEPTEDTIKIAKGANHQSIVSEFKKIGIDLKETKPRQAKPKQKQVRSTDRKKLAPKETPKKAKAAAAKKEAPKSGKPEAAETKLEKAIGDEK